MTQWAEILRKPRSLASQHQDRRGAVTIAVRVRGFALPFAVVDGAVRPEHPPACLPTLLQEITGGGDRHGREHFQDTGTCLGHDCNIK